MKIKSSVENLKWEISGTIYKVSIENENLLQKLENKIRSNIDDKISYETNVKGRMTHWDAFKHDDDFKELISSDVNFVTFSLISLGDGIFSSAITYILLN